MGFPNRERKPRHPGHFRKPKPEKKVPFKIQRELEEANPYKDGRMRIFLDDERGCPPGWTLAENVAEFKQILEACPPVNLAAVSLDWHLGAGITNGEKAAEFLAAHIAAHADAFDNLDFITLHSSDRDKARLMARPIVEALEANDSTRMVSVTLGLPVDTPRKRRLF